MKQDHKDNNDHAHSKKQNVTVRRHKHNSRSRSSSYERRKDSKSSRSRDNRRRDSRSNSYEHRRNKNRNDNRNRRDYDDNNYDKKYSSHRDDSRRRHQDDRSKAPYEFSDSEIAGKSSKGQSKHDRKNQQINKRSDSRDNDSSDYEYSRAGEKKHNRFGDAGDNQGEEGKEKIVKEEPCFEPSGILAEYSNSVNGVTLKFTEPLDAAIPRQEWRLYPFKDSEELEPLKMRGQSVFLLGKDKRVADIMLDNPSCSAQHAVIQFREKFVTRELSQAEMEASGTFQPFVTEAVVKPYIMDLGSTNKTFLNGDQLEDARYYELREEDILKFGQSTREYVLMSK